MIILDATNEKIQFFLGGAITTNKLHAFSAWSDKTSTTSTPGSTYAESNDTTDVDLVASPAASTQRVIIALGITNRDTAAATVTVQWTNGSTDIILTTVTLAVGDTLQYVKDSGWSAIDVNGKIKSSGGGGGGDALTTDPLSQFAATTSLQLKGVISDETGSGALVFATSPALVTPILGTPTSGTLTNCTGLPIAGGGTGGTTAATARAALGAANTTCSWPFVFSGRVLRGLGTGTGTHLNSTALAGTDSNLSDNTDPDGCLSGFNMADGAASDLHFQFPIPSDLDLTAIVTAEVYYRIGGAGTGAAVEIEFNARNIADDEVNVSGGALFSVANAKSVNSYASGDLVVHSLGTVFGASTLDANSIIHGTLYRDAFAGNADDTLAATIMMGAILFTGTRLTT